jgi:hypothetical protein
VIFLDRSSRGPDPWLDWKVRVFFLGAALALVGMAMGNRVVTGVAMGVLLVGVILRFVGGGGRVGPEEEGPDEDGGGRENGNG